MSPTSSDDAFTFSGGTPANDPAFDAAGVPDPDSPKPQAPIPEPPVDLMAVQGARIAALEAEVQKHKDAALRAMAEAENTRRRLQREKEESQRFAVANLARDLLGVADNLARALDGLGTTEDERLKSFAEGVGLTQREMIQTFERHGIRRVEPLGERFDPNLHQAMFEMEDAARAPGTVAQVIQAGYTLNDRLLRPALVGVVKAAPAKPADDAA